MYPRQDFVVHMPKVIVLRMGHRIDRDKRVTTHVGLVARAFGADGMIVADTRDKGIEGSVGKVVQQWGGPFEIRTGEPWRQVLRNWRANGGVVVHLTMYGIPVDKVVERARGKDILVVVGAEKMPGEIYGEADLNVAVGNQPHSEVAALAIFLDRIFSGAELKKEFKNGTITVLPTEKGKKVEKTQ